MVNYLKLLTWRKCLQHFYHVFIPKCSNDVRNVISCVLFGMSFLHKNLFLVNRINKSHSLYISDSLTLCVLTVASMEFTRSVEKHYQFALQKLLASIWVCFILSILLVTEV